MILYPLSSATLETSPTPSTNEAPFHFNPFQPDFYSNPYPVYRQMRTEAPFYRVSGLIGKELFLTRFHDVRAVLTDVRFQVDPLPQRIQAKSAYLEPPNNFDALTKTISQWLFFLNPPDHTKFRGLVGKAFSAGSIAKMQDFVQATINELVTPIQNGQVVDVMSTIAYPLPALLTANILGVPLEDCDVLTNWSRDLFWVFDQPMSLAGYTKLNQIAAEFTAYFLDLLIQRKKNPQDDLMTHLAAAIGSDAALSESDILSFCAMVFSVGQETTGSAIGSSLLALLQHPEQWAQLKQEPDLLKAAVEELIRYESPTQILSRLASEDIELNGRMIYAGECVRVCLGAANRDPEQFSEPDKLNIARPITPHVAFGAGIHNCLGGPLARMMCQLTLQTLTQHFKELQMVDDSPEWRKNFIVRGLTNLPIEFQR
jgi:pimeloyl-[acyl-carrier protein] synthase